MLRRTGPGAAPAHARRAGVSATPSPAAWAPTSESPSWWRHHPAVKATHRAAFLRQLASLLHAGVPLVQSLEVMARSATQPLWRDTAWALRTEVATGQPLAECLRRRPRIFTALQGHLVAAGEAAGLLEPALRGLALHEERHAATAARVRAALAYPAAVVAIAAAVVAVMLVQVVPTFAQVFASFGADLPLLTRLVMRTSDSLAGYGLWWLLGLVVLAVAVKDQLRRRPQWRLALQRGLLHAPVVGPLLMQSVMARWCRTVSAVFGAGLNLVDTLGHAAQAAGHEAVAQATLQAREEVARGQRLAPALQASGVFSPMVVQMVAIGEESGTVDALTERAADALEVELDAALKGLSSLIEPVIIVVLGLVIGTVVVSMYLPILQMGSIA